SRSLTSSLDTPSTGIQILPDSTGSLDKMISNWPKKDAYFMTLLLAAVLGASCQHGPPKEAGRFREPDLVAVAQLDPTIRLDIRYATTNNFMHGPAYAKAKAFLQRPAAEAPAR